MVRLENKTDNKERSGDELTWRKKNDNKCKYLKMFYKLLCYCITFEIF